MLKHIRVQEPSRVRVRDPREREGVRLYRARHQWSSFHYEELGSAIDFFAEFICDWEQMCEKIDSHDITKEEHEG